MEVIRDNFLSELGWIQSAIDEADFIAIDAEFSGLHTDQSKRTSTTTLDESYADLRRAASQFITVQIGISAFRFDSSTGNYVAKPFNFYIFPTSLAGYAPNGRCFLTEASSLDFLSKNRFDFNKWVYNGIHYITKEEEDAYRADKMRMLNKGMDIIAIDEINKDWIMGVMSMIDSWRKDPRGEDFLNIPTNNSYQRRLVHQEVRQRWPTLLETRGCSGYINISKTTQERLNQKHAQGLIDIEKDVKHAGGFRLVMEMLSKCGKPVVGHNISIDLAYMLSQFFGSLPETMEGYIKMIHQYFPTVIDTKYVSYSDEALRSFASDTSLGALQSIVNGSQFSNPKVTLHVRHPRYYTNDHSHEAGFDAYITGIIMIKLMAFINNKEAAAASPSTPVPDKDIAAFAKRSVTHVSSRANSPVPKNGSQAAKTPPVSKKAPQVGRALATHAAPEVVPIVPVKPAPRLWSSIVQGKPKASAVLAVPVHDQKRAEELLQQNEDTMSESEESEYEYVQEPEPVTHDPPFDINSPRMAIFHNVLHWGRSSHGTISLVGATQ